MSCIDGQVLAVFGAEFERNLKQRCLGGVSHAVMQNPLYQLSDFILNSSRTQDYPLEWSRTHIHERVLWLIIR